MPLHGEDHLIAHARLEAVGNDTQPIIGLMSFDVEGFAKCLFVKWIQEPDWMHSFEECYAIWLEGYSFWFCIALSFTRFRCEIGLNVTVSLRNARPNVSFEHFALKDALISQLEKIDRIFLPDNACCWFLTML